MRAAATAAPSAAAAAQGAEAAGQGAGLPSHDVQPTAGTEINSSTAAAAAAAEGGRGGEVLPEPCLPAVRVAVCKEISRAMELKVGHTAAWLQAVVL